MNTLTKSTGIALALAAAGLAGCNSMGTPDKMAAKSSMSANVECYGVNKCKGHNDCKTASNACKGHAACKGQGFLKMTPHACSEVGGKTSS